MTSGTTTHARDADKACVGDTRLTVDVAIIGAGLAGLTAARDLQLSGCRSFVVIEARDRIGGRVYNIPLGDGLISEGGGEWLSPGQTALADLARELGIDTFDTYEAGETVYRLGDMAVPGSAGHVGEMRMSALNAELGTLSRGVPSATPWEAADAEATDRLSVQDFLDRHELTPFEAFTFNRYLLLNTAVRPDELSLLHQLSNMSSRTSSVERLQATKEGAPEKRFVGGSQQLCISIAEALRDRLSLSSPVRKILGWDRDVVELHTDRGVIRARQVIAALSPALCDQIVFEPPLPEGRGEMQRQWPRNSKMRKTVHVYARPFWRDAGFNGQIFAAEGPLLWSCDNSPPDGSVGVLNAFVSVDGLSRDRNFAEPTISAIYADAFGDDALHPIQFHDLDWSTVDPWSLSCTSPRPPGFITKWGKFLHPAVGRIIWSGTETADLWPNFMEGAVRSGHRAALQALGALTHA